MGKQLRRLDLDNVSEVRVDYLDEELNAWTIDVFGVDDDDCGGFVAGHVCNETGKVFLPIPPALLQYGGGLSITEAAEDVSREVKERLGKERDRRSVGVPLTWEQVGLWIQSMSEEQKKQSATVYNVLEDEYIPLFETGRTMENDVLEAGHMLLFTEQDEQL